jgi:hypothetical protein
MMSHNNLRAAETEDQQGQHRRMLLDLVLSDSFVAFGTGVPSFERPSTPPKKSQIMSG